MTDSGTPAATRAWITFFKLIFLDIEQRIVGIDSEKNREDTLTQLKKLSNQVKMLLDTVEQAQIAITGAAIARKRDEPKPGDKQ